MKKLESFGMGAERTLLEDKSLLPGLNTYNGILTCKAVADSINMEYVPAEHCLSVIKRAS